MRRAKKMLPKFSFQYMKKEFVTENRDKLFMW